MQCFNHFLYFRCDEPLSSPGISKSISEGIIEEEEEEEGNGESNHKRKKDDDQEVADDGLGHHYLQLITINVQDNKSG